AESHIWLNDGTGNFTTSTIINFDVTNTDDSGNYGSVWSDFDGDGDVDLYIAKCRQFVGDPSDGRRIDVLMVNDGSNNFTSEAADFGLADSGQTWTCNFADIDDDGDLDAIETDYDIPAKLLENDGTGHMTNIASGSGFDISDIYPIESVMEDFDNDGYVDILVTGSHADLFHNNGDHTFTKLTNVFNSNGMESFAIGDLNHDGKIDIYSSYASIYTSPTSIDDVYWMNTTNNGNHFITFNLIGSASSEGAYGARVTLYGSWGKQVREVHAGESYGTCNSTNLHFGLGTATTIDSAVIHWPSGTNQNIMNPSADQFVTVKEDSCVSPEVFVSASGPLVICAGETITLTGSDLPSGYSYKWSNDSTTQSISVSSTGSYYLTAVSGNDACSVTTPAVTILQTPDETPTITEQGDLTFCAGGSVLLTSSPASSYLWTNGDTTQSTYATESGAYTVTIQGTCQQWTSAPINVNVWAAPAPATTDAYTNVPANVTLSASGNHIYWYDVATGGTPIDSGATFTTYANSTETFYAEDHLMYQDDSLPTGQKYHSGSNAYSGSTTNAWIIFDVYEASILKSVKVYTDSPGDRLIELRDASGNVIQNLMVNIPADSGRIALNFYLPPGNGYELGTNTAQNDVLLGYDSPRLERSSTGVNYPYTAYNLLSLINSPFGTDYYYYFYDWEVQKVPTICISPRSPATVYLTTGIQSNNFSNSLEVFPNPTDGIITLKSNIPTNEKVNIRLLDVSGKVLLNEDLNNFGKDEELQLDLRKFSKGIYFLDIINGMSTDRRKVVID
ncbi:MAG: ASPIC/UnbV domain-containing protein, partial [Chitinophagales bacterium]